MLWGPSQQLSRCSIGQAQVFLTLRMMGELVKRLQAKGRVYAKALGRRQQAWFTDPKGGNVSLPAGRGSV